MIYTLLICLVNFCNLLTSQIVCEEYASCANDTLTNANILCYGEHSCAESSLYATDYIVCIGDRSCTKTIIEPLNNNRSLVLHCLETRSCEGAPISNLYSVVTDNDANYAFYYSIISNASTIEAPMIVPHPP